MSMDEKKKVSVTSGMARAPKQAARTCGGCSLKIPVYPGRYPDKCPECGHSLKTPSMEEQIAMVRAGIPPADVVKMAHPFRAGMIEKLDKGIEAGQSLIDKGVETLREQDPISDIERLARGAAGKARAAKAHVKGKAGEAKKHVKTGIAARKAKKKRKEKKPAKPKKPGAKKPQRSGARKESMEETKMRTSLTIQEDGIKDLIRRRIDEHGHADLSAVARDFKANPIAVYNLVKKRQEDWGLLVGGNGYKVYPRTETDHMRDTTS